MLSHKIIDKAICYEPEPENFKILKCNLILNNLEGKVETFPYALSYKNTETILELSEENFGDHRIRLSTEDGIYNENTRKTIKVVAKTLDNCLAENKINTEDLLVWIDVQGYEGQVLQGAKKLLLDKPSLVLEFWPYGLYRTGGINNILESLGQYSFFYNLADAEPMLNPESVTTLYIYYEKNKTNDNFMIDILLTERI